MITGASASAMMRSDVVEVEYRNGTYYGLQLSDFCGAISDNAHFFKVFEPTVLTATPVSVPSTFMGLTVENVGSGTNTASTPWSYGVNYSIHRILGQGTYWAEIESNADGNYNWNKLDAAVDAAIAAGKTVMWNVAYTPTGYGSNAAARRSSGVSTAGWASAPSDLAATMQVYPAKNSAVWSNFLIAAVQRYAGRIKYYVMWNEPNYRTYNTATQANAPCGNWFDTSDTGTLKTFTAQTSVSGNQNYTQYVQLQADLYGIVHQYDPTALVLSGEMYGESNNQSIGGRQAGDVTFNALLTAGAGDYCDGYCWHNYMDEYLGINGVSLRLNTFLNTVMGKVASTGSTTRNWYATETGHNNLGDLNILDQRLWLGRHVLIAAAKGFQTWGMYAWDSLNPSTQVMGLWAPSNATTNPGLRQIADDFSYWAGVLQGATITYAAILNNGQVCATINGTTYIV